jgi:hypothetical protein
MKLTSELSFPFPLEDDVAHGSLAFTLAVADSFIGLCLAVDEVVKLVVLGGVGLSAESRDAHLGALLLAEDGIGHVGNQIPVTGELWKFVL